MAITYSWDIINLSREISDCGVYYAEWRCTVVDEKGKLYGIITWTDIHNAAIKHERHLTIQDYCVTDLITVNQRDTLSEALDCLGSREISHLPVVDTADRKKLIGIITKGDIIKAYNRQRLTRKKMSRVDK